MFGYSVFGGSVVSIIAVCVCGLYSVATTVCPFLLLLRRTCGWSGDWAMLI
jgi:hypothetical protein